MKPLTRKYLIFFLIAYLLFRLPSLISPLATQFIFKQFINAADSHGIKISIDGMENQGLRTLVGYGVRINRKGFVAQQYYLDKISSRLESIFPPVIKIESSLYEGNLSCSIKSEGFIDLISKKTARLYCDLKQLNLQSFPDTKNISILGKIDASLETDLAEDTNKITSTAEIRLINGYIDFSKVIGSGLIKIPPLERGDLFAALHKEQGNIRFKEVAFKSNFGFMKGTGLIISDLNNKSVTSIDLNGTFDLTSDGERNLSPWVSLINKGKTLKSKTGSFNITGPPQALKLIIND